MLFNSYPFAVLLLIVFTLYWSVKQQTLRNGILLIASYVFYGFWDWRFLSLIFLSSLVDFLVGKSIIKQSSRKNQKILLGISLLINLGSLGFFKYYNFFAENFQFLLTSLGIRTDMSSLNVILPVGISFYTFQTLSYTIDIYRGRVKPTSDMLSFFTFVAFFPQLVAGPIERASRLLPQFQKKITFNQNLAEDGLKQMLWGFFKKMVVADNAALIVNEIFTNHSNASPTAHFVGVVLFAFQIYTDFSGYSDIAIGTAKLFGIHLMTNFRLPYFSESFREFWRRWHISLSTWFRDYVYIPLGGNRKGFLRQILAIYATFLLSGLWHGANLTFIFWGLIHAIFYSIEITIEKLSNHGSKTQESYSIPVRLLKAGVVLFLVLISWTFFRAATIHDAFQYLKEMIHPSENVSIYLNMLREKESFVSSVIFIILLLITEWITRNKPHPFSELKKLGMSRYLIYLAFVLIIFLFAPGQKSDFIYFQF